MNSPDPATTPAPQKITPDCQPVFPCWAYRPEGGWFWFEQHGSEPSLLAFTHWHPDQPTAPTCTPSEGEKPVLGNSDDSSVAPAEATATPRTDAFCNEPVMNEGEGMSPNEHRLVGWERFARGLERELREMTSAYSVRCDECEGLSHQLETAKTEHVQHIKEIESLRKAALTPTHSAQEAAERAASEIADQYFHNTALEIRAIFSAIIIRHLLSTPTQSQQPPLSPGSGEAMREAIADVVLALCYHADKRPMFEARILAAITPFLAQPATPPLPSGEADLEALRLCELARGETSVALHTVAAHALDLTLTILTTDGLPVDLKKRAFAAHRQILQYRKQYDLRSRGEVERGEHDPAIDAPNHRAFPSAETLRANAEALAEYYRTDPDVKAWQGDLAHPPSVKIGDGKGRGLPEDVRSFIERVTLHLQRMGNEEGRRFFHEAYALYNKYDVEGWHAKQKAAMSAQSSQAGREEK